MMISQSDLSISEYFAGRLDGGRTGDGDRD